MRQLPRNLAFAIWGILFWPAIALTAYLHPPLYDLMNEQVKHIPFVGGFFGVTSLTGLWIFVGYRLYEEEPEPPEPVEFGFEVKLMVLHPFPRTGTYPKTDRVERALRIGYAVTMGMELTLTEDDEDPIVGIVSRVYADASGASNNVTVQVELKNPRRFDDLESEVEWESIIVSSGAERFRAA